METDYYDSNKVCKGNHQINKGDKEYTEASNVGDCIYDSTQYGNNVVYDRYKKTLVFSPESLLKKNEVTTTSSATPTSTVVSAGNRIGISLLVFCVGFGFYVINF